jgi:hypothetical protein
MESLNLNAYCFSLAAKWANILNDSEAGLWGRLQQDVKFADMLFVRLVTM